jgi:putative CocE/NonD family hydrolase
MIPNVAPPEPYFNFPYEAGGFFLAGALTWTLIVENEATADLSGLAFEGAVGVYESEEIRKLPVIDLDQELLGREVPFWREWIAHPDLDEYWRSLDFIEPMKGLDIPVLHQSGWFDGDGIGSKLNYLGLTANGHARQKLVLGPWGHTDTDTRFGPHGIDFGPKAVIDLQKTYLRWMDRWLKGIENGIDEEPAVSLFVMGANDWLHGETYPLEGTVLTPYYLARGEEGEGVLTTAVPIGDAAVPEEYVYDPGDPTPVDPTGRKDLLVFKTPVSDEPLTLAGPVSAVLYAASSAKDTDWFVRTAKLRTDGNPLLLGRSVIRARYRESFSEPKLLEPDEVYEYHLDVWQTGVRIEPGEQLIVVVSSAVFPMFSRNLNTGGHNEMETEYVSAHQTIYHDAEHPSHLLLPVILEPEYGKR